MYLVILRETEDSVDGILFLQVFDCQEEATDCFTYLQNAIMSEMENSFLLNLVSIEEATEEMLPKVVYTLKTLQKKDISKEDFLLSLNDKKAWKIELLSVDYTGEEFHEEKSSVEEGTHWKFTVQAETPELARNRAIRHLKKTI